MRLIALIFFLLINSRVDAQLYGAQWVLGYRESVLDFRNDTLINYPIGPLMPMFLTSANICDSSGNLLYYTNGIYIAGADGSQIANGDSLSPCNWSNQQSCCGLDIPQAALFLPMPSNSRYYYLVHYSADTLNESAPGTIYYSVIDKDTLNQQGAVIRKNVILFHGSIMRPGGLTACKHANGRDWWIVMAGYNSNTFYKFLLTPEGLNGPFIQDIGPGYSGSFQLSHSKFSQDGSKFVTSCDEGPVLIMDFDRCAGIFSNPTTIFNNVSSPPSSGGIPEFSPNGRFVYVSNTINLNQYDLWAANPQLDSSMVDAADSSDPAQIEFPQIAPNGKIYITCFTGGYYILHAINYPDLKGDSCVYVDTAITTLTTNSINFPNMINYQLGTLLNSGCDTIHTDTTGVGIITTEVNNLLRIMPNPANKYVYVEMGMQGDYEFELVNMIGQVVDKKETRQVDIFDTERLAGGVYFLRAMNQNSLNIVATQKFIVQH